LHRDARARLLSVMAFPSGHALSRLVRGLPQDQVDHTIWALSRGVTSGDRPSAAEQRVSGIRSSVPRIPSVCPSDSNHIVVDAHDLPGLARVRTQVLGWKVLSERENEIVIGTDQNAPVGMCFMPVTDPKTVKNRVHLDLTSSAADRDQEIDRLLALGARRRILAKTRPGTSTDVSAMAPVPTSQASGSWHATSCKLTPCSSSACTSSSSWRSRPAACTSGGHRQSGRLLDRPTGP
jgi:hypothetical protein